MVMVVVVMDRWPSGRDRRGATRGTRREWRRGSSRPWRAPACSVTVPLWAKNDELLAATPTTAAAAATASRQRRSDEDEERRVVRHIRGTRRERYSRSSMAGVGAALEQSLAHASQEDSELKACIALSIVSRSLLLLLPRLAFVFFLSLLLGWLIGWLVDWCCSLCISLWIVSIMSSQPELDAALLEAAKRGRLEEIRSLLDRRANINAASIDNYTPLHWACRLGHHQCIELLLDRHANINAVDKYNDTPLHDASRNGHHQCIELLLDRGANINAVNKYNDTPLVNASRNGHHQCIELLIDRGADKSIKDVREDGCDSLLHLLLI